MAKRTLEPYTTKVDRYSVTQAWQDSVGDTFCYHRHLIMDTNLTRINVEQNLYKAGKELISFAICFKTKQGINIKGIQHLTVT